MAFVRPIIMRTVCRSAKFAAGMGGACLDGLQDIESRANWESLAGGASRLKRSQRSTRDSPSPDGMASSEYSLRDAPWPRLENDPDTGGRAVKVGDHAHRRRSPDGFRLGERGHRGSQPPLSQSKNEI
jgi:hypothetical protein